MLDLLWIALTNMRFQTITETHDLLHYGRYPWWWRLRAELGRRYWWDSPYRIVQRQGASTGRDPAELIWGETPCGTLEHIFRQLQVGPGDVFCDLGSGRGLTVLFAHLRFGVRAVGYEIVPAFVAKARSVSRSLHLDAAQVEWRMADFLHADLAEFTVALAAWTTFPDPVRQAASQVLESLPAGARVATLTHAIESPQFTLLASEVLRFSWGTGTVYYYRRITG